MSIGEHHITHSDGKANPVENRLNSMNSCCSHKSRNSFQRSYQIFFLTLFFQTRYFVLTEYCFTTYSAPFRRLIFWSLVEVSLHSVWSPSFPFPNSQWWLFSKQGVGGGSLWSPIVSLTRSDLFSIFHSSILSKIIIPLIFGAMFAGNYFQGTLEDLFPG